MPEKIVDADNEAVRCPRRTSFICSKTNTNQMSKKGAPYELATDSNRHGRQNSVTRADVGCLCPAVSSTTVSADFSGRPWWQQPGEQLEQQGLGGRIFPALNPQTPRHAVARWVNP